MSNESTVSVIIPVWNVRPYLAECLDSVFAQTLPAGRVEIVAVDDASTDGSGALLDEYAERHPQLRVVHESANSGGPGRPRNVGLDLATGTYVFFLDADDYLGSEALERLVATAERNRSDIVLAKTVGVDGRIGPTRWARRQNVDRATLIEVYDTASVFKLFRTELLRRVGVRFEEALAGGEDAPFVIRAYFEARVISVVADYPCYYLRHRAGSQTTRADRHDDLVAKVGRIERGEMAVVAQYRGPGIARDALMVKHLAAVLRQLQGTRYTTRSPEERHLAFAAAARVIRRWHTRRTELGLPPWLALRAYCLGHGLEREFDAIVETPPEKAFGDPVVEGRRVFAAFPPFRSRARIPDRLFDITGRVVLRADVPDVSIAGDALRLRGNAFMTLLGGSTTVVLRRWPFGPEKRFATQASPTPELHDRQARYPMAGFAAAVDLSSSSGIDDGLWDLRVAVRAHGVERRGPIRPGMDGAAPAAEPAVRSGAERQARAVLEVGATGELRVVIGRVGAIPRMLDAVRADALRVAHRIVRMLRSFRWGRLALLVLDELRPGWIPARSPSNRGRHRGTAGYA